MGVSQLSSGRWRVQIRRKTVRFDDLFDTKEEADQACREALGRAATDTSLLTVRQLWEKYVASSDFSNKASHTQKTERCRIQPVLAALGHCPLVQFENDRQRIHDFMDARATAVSPRTGKKLSKATQRLELAALSAVVKFGVRRRIIREDFLATVPRPVSKPRTRRIESREQGTLRIRASGSGPESVAARFLLIVRHLGCRPGELMKLGKDQIRLDRLDVTFLGTKNGTNRTVHVTSAAYEFIDIQLQQTSDDCPYLFGTWSNRKEGWVPYNYLYGVTLLRKSGIVRSDYHAHAGRREFISHGIEQGAELTVLKKQTGHKSVQALEMYDQSASTTPEIRRKLDALSASTADETLKNALNVLCKTEEQRRRMGELLKEDVPVWAHSIQWERKS